MSYPDSVKNKAFQLYMADNTAPKIVELLNNEFNIHMTAPTIYCWSRKGNWKEEKKKVSVQTIVAVSERNTEELISTVEEHLGAYQKLLAAGIEILDNGTFVKKAESSDAIHAVDVAIQGQRKIQSGLVHMNFVNDLYHVIISHVKDDDVLKKIAADIRGVLADYSGVR